MQATHMQRNTSKNARSIAVGASMNTMKVLNKNTKTTKTVASKSIKAKATKQVASKAAKAPKGLSRLVRHTLGHAGVYCQPIGAREDATASYPAGTVILGKWGYSITALTLRGVRCETTFRPGQAPKCNAVVRISHGTRPLIWPSKYDGTEVAVIAKKQSDGDQ